MMDESGDAPAHEVRAGRGIYSHRSKGQGEIALITAQCNSDACFPCFRAVFLVASEKWLRMIPGDLGDFGTRFTRKS